MSQIDPPLWPLRKAAAAVFSLGRAAGWRVSSQISPPAPPSGLSGLVPEGSPGSLSDYLDAVASAYGLESEAVQMRLDELPEYLGQAGPAVLFLTAPQPGLLLVVSANRHSLRVLGPDGTTRLLRRAEVVAWLCEPMFAPLRSELDTLLASAGLAEGARRQRAVQMILHRRLATQSISGCFLLRLAAARPLGQLVQEVGLGRLLGLYGVAHVTQYVLGLILIFLVGESALNGHLDRGWLWAAGLLMACTPPFMLLESWVLGRIAIAAGIVLRRRLLWGAVKLPLDAARKSGYGDFVCQINESEAVEMGLRSGGISASAAGLDLLGALPVLAVASGTAAVVLMGWVVLLVGLSYGYYRSRLTWTDARFRLIGDLLEKMLGHRTRLVQEPKALRHRGEDEALVEYHQQGRGLDGWSAVLFGFLPSGWLVAGATALVPLWLDSQASAGRLAIGLGGVMLGMRALGKLASGLSQLAGVAIALRRCQHLLDSAAQPEPQPLTAVSPSFAPGATVLEAKRLTVRYGQEAKIPALRDLTLRVRAGERVLLQGPSGSGKSTLASSLTGLLPIESGQILLGGLDMSALGPRRWRKIVATAPQFHENHLFSQPLAFNLLMGRAWPPSPQDLQEATTICEELGLGPLLSRMPSGLYTHVGETGWQLSHGERSRVYIARTLLQRAQVVLLDESFAALDPETLAITLRCVFARVPTLFVIAHP